MKHNVHILLIFAVAGCSPCSNDVRSHLVSPDGTLEAFVFERSCGVTTPFGTQVSVEPAGDALPNSEGNVFQIIRPDSLAGQPGGGLGVTVRWLGPRQLEVSYDTRAEVRWAVVKWGNLSLTYRPR
jgi:hypothetical protein